MADPVEIHVSADAAGERVSRLLGDLLPLEPQDLIRQLLAENKVKINGETCTPDDPLRRGQVITVLDLAALRQSLRVESIPAEPVYEDEHVIVVNKPAGCTVTRERNATGCPFRNGILDYLRASGQAARIREAHYRPRAIHRIDRDTSGVVAFAVSREGELHLARQFRERTVRKEYLAVVHGEVRDDAGEISDRIRHDPRDVSRMFLGGRGAKPALTRYEVTERFRRFTHLRVWPHTGRRHQIRIHLTGIGHPVVADETYAGAALLLSQIKRGYKQKPGRSEKPLLSRPALHAHALEFMPVGRDDPIRVEAAVPDDVALVLKMLRKYGRRGE